jgi:hypothetical protein
MSSPSSAAETTSSEPNCQVVAVAMQEATVLSPFALAADAELKSSSMNGNSAAADFATEFKFTFPSDVRQGPIVSNEPWDQTWWKTRVGVEITLSNPNPGDVLVATSINGRAATHARIIEPSPADGPEVVIADNVWGDKHEHLRSNCLVIWADHHLQNASVLGGPASLLIEVTAIQPGAVISAKVLRGAMVYSSIDDPRNLVLNAGISRRPRVGEPIEVVVDAMAADPSFRGQVVGFDVSSTCGDVVDGKEGISPVTLSLDRQQRRFSIRPSKAGRCEILVSSQTSVTSLRKSLQMTINVSESPSLERGNTVIASVLVLLLVVGLFLKVGVPKFDRRVGRSVQEPRS